MLSRFSTIRHWQLIVMLTFVFSLQLAIAPAAVAQLSNGGESPPPPPPPHKGLITPYQKQPRKSQIFYYPTAVYNTCQVVQMVSEYAPLP